MKYLFISLRNSFCESSLPLGEFSYELYSSHFLFMINLIQYLWPTLFVHIIWSWINHFIPFATKFNFIPFARNTIVYHWLYSNFLFIVCRIISYLPFTFIRLNLSHSVSKKEKKSMIALFFFMLQTQLYIIDFIIIFYSWYIE